jgi:hypothetical protein
MKLIACFILSAFTLESSRPHALPAETLSMFDEFDNKVLSENQLNVNDETVAPVQEENEFTLEFEAKLTQDVVKIGGSKSFYYAFTKYFNDLISNKKSSNAQIIINDIKIKMVPNNKTIYFSIEAECEKLEQINQCKSAAKTASEKFNLANIFPYLYEFGYQESVNIGLQF